MSDVGVARKIAILRKHPLFVHMRDWDLERLAVHARIDRAPAGTKIYSKDEPGGSMIMVLSGFIIVYSTSEEGREVAFDIFGPDEICGEIALLDGKFRSADAKALKDFPEITWRGYDRILTVLSHKTIRLPWRRSRNWRQPILWQPKWRQDAVS